MANLQIAISFTSIFLSYFRLATSDPNESQHLYVIAVLCLYTKVFLKRSEVDSHTHRKGQYVVLSMDKRNIKVCFNFMAIVTIAIVFSWKGNFVEKCY